MLSPVTFTPNSKSDYVDPTLSTDHNLWYPDKCCGLHCTAHSYKNTQLCHAGKSYFPFYWKITSCPEPIGREKEKSEE